MIRYLIALSLLAVVACGGDEPAKKKSCKLDDPRTCSPGKVCELVEGEGKPACFAPVVVQGRVFELVGGDAVPGAHVTAEESSGRPVGEVAVTGTDGSYTLRIPSVRTGAGGAPVGQTIKLRAAAQDHVSFPSGVRLALPLDTATAVATSGKPWVVTGAAAELGLELLPLEQQGLPAVSGKVERAPSQDAILVAAEPVGGAALVAVTGQADSTGAYTLFNVAPGGYLVQAWQRGSNYQPVEISVEEVDLEDVDLSLTEVAAGTLTGDVSIVAGNGLTTVVVALESTFDDVLNRGVLVPGLRAPDPGLPPNVDGAFSISGIPDGDYVVLAAFENDGLVRDPDPDIAGTQIQHITVRNGLVSSNPSFKVTSAIRMIGPGASATVEEVAGMPNFRWQAYPSAKNYLLEVYDTYGTPIWSTNVSGTSVEYAGSTALIPEVPYQWRLTAFGNASNPISLSEDLLGVFSVAP